MYEGDSPLAERRAAALSLDPGLLAELLGRAELRELLDPEVLAEVEAELQRLAPDRKATRRRGRRRPAAAARPADRRRGRRARCRAPATDVGDWLDAARARPPRGRGPDRRRRALGRVEDVGRLRDALGVPVPPGIPDAFTEPVDDPLGDLVGRYARTHGPFTTADVAARLGLGVAVVRQTLHRLGGQGRVLEGEFRPAGTGTEWCDAEVLRRLRRRSLARLRQEVEPVEPAGARPASCRAWQHVGPARLRGVDGVVTVIDQLAGCAGARISAWSRSCSPPGCATTSRRCSTSSPPTGEVLWAGARRRCPAPTAGSRCTSPTRRR